MKACKMKIHLVLGMTSLNTEIEQGFFDVFEPKHSCP